MNYTDHQLVEQYLKLKAHVASRTETFDTEIKPYKDGMSVIENEFLKRLDERGADNTKTDVGTAYKSTITNFQVVDEEAFLKFVMQYPSLRDMMAIKPVKDPIKEYMNGSKEPPPGIEQSQFIRVNIRRS